MRIWWRENKREEFKNVISGIEQARLVAQRLREQKTNNFASQNSFHATSFTVGDKVKHEKFGEGQIEGIVNIGGSTIYRVAFDKFGIKAVDAEFNRMVLLQD